MMHSFSLVKSVPKKSFSHLQISHRQGQPSVLTADVLPRDIDDLEPRLRTRFESGVIIDMQPPDLETLTAIVTQKSLEIGMEIGPNLALYIASGSTGTSERSMECSIDSNAVSICWKNPTIEFAKEHIGQILSHQTTQASADDIIEAVCSVCAVRVGDIKREEPSKSLFVPGTLQCTWFEPLPVCHFQKLQGYLVDVINRQLTRCQNPSMPCQRSQPSKHHLVH